jgi:hypothetical protein
MPSEPRQNVQGGTQNEEIGDFQVGEQVAILGTLRQLDREKHLAQVDIPGPNGPSRVTLAAAQLRAGFEPHRPRE